MNENINRKVFVSHFSVTPITEPKSKNMEGVFGCDRIRLSVLPVNENGAIDLIYLEKTMPAASNRPFGLLIVLRFERKGHVE